MGGDRFENLGTMLDEGKINDAAVYAALGADDLDRYMEVGKGKLSTDKLLDAMSYFNSDNCKAEKDADGNIVVDEITNTKLANGNYAMDTYYQHN